MILRAASARLLSDWHLLAAIGICVLAAALRIPPLRESLWLDELHTAWCALGPLDEVAKRAAMGNQGPLFFWLEWLLTVIFGESEFSLRLPSLIAGILLPLLVFRFARRWKAEFAGLVAAGLIAIDPLSIFYTTEARPYALVQLITVFFMTVTARVAENPNRKVRAAWVALAVALFYLHYTSALIVAAAAMFLASVRLISVSQFTYSLSNLAVDLLLVVIACNLSAWNVRHIFAQRSNWAAFIESLPPWAATRWTPLPGWAWLLLIIAALVGCWLRPKPSGRQSLPLLFLVGVWFLVPLGIAWLSTATDLARLFFHRYIAGVFPAAALIAGLCVQAIPTRWSKSWIGLATVGISLWSGGILHHIFHDGRVIVDRNEDWRTCIEWLNEQLPRKGYPVLVYSGLIEADGLAKPHDRLLDDYCLCPVNSLYPLDAAPSDVFPLTLHNPAQLPQAAEQLAVHRGGCCLVVRGSEELAEKIAISLGDTLEPPMPKHGSYELTSFGSVRAVLIHFE